MVKTMEANGASSEDIRARRGEIGAGIRELSARNEEAITRLKTLIGRFEREVPEYPRTGLETMLANVVKQGAMLTETAATHGLVRNH
jgi:hypothetical protein